MGVGLGWDGMGWDGMVWRDLGRESGENLDRDKNEGAVSERCLRVCMLVSRSLGLVNCCLCVCERERERQLGTVRPRRRPALAPVMGGGGHISKDVMFQASLDTHRWVPHLGYSRHTRAHTGGKTDQAAL